MLATHESPPLRLQRARGHGAGSGMDPLATATIRCDIDQQLFRAGSLQSTELILQRVCEFFVSSREDRIRAALITRLICADLQLRESGVAELWRPVRHKHIDAKYPDARSPDIDQAGGERITLISHALKAR